MVETCENSQDCCKSLEVSKKKKVSRRLGANQIPEEILNNTVLNEAITKLLPKNYNFEIHKTIFKVSRFNKISTVNGRPIIIIWELLQGPTMRPHNWLPIRRDKCL